MSKISIKPADTGTATFTIEAPATNTNRTFTLPDEAGSILTNGGAINVDQSAPAESAVIDSSGNVGIGTSSPAMALDVSGQMRASSGILFGTDTAASNTLDDYETGVWTPTSVSGITSLIVTRATYTKVGGIVTATIFGDIQADASPGVVRIGGLPFTCSENGSALVGHGNPNFDCFGGCVFDSDTEFSTRHTLTTSSKTIRLAVHYESA